MKFSCVILFEKVKFTDSFFPFILSQCNGNTYLCLHFNWKKTKFIPRRKKERINFKLNRGLKFYHGFYLQKRRKKCGNANLILWPLNLLSAHYKVVKLNNKLTVMTLFTVCTFINSAFGLVSATMCKFCTLHHLLTVKIMAIFTVHFKANFRSIWWDYECGF